MSDKTIGKTIRHEIDAVIITLVKKGLITMEDYETVREDYLQNCTEEEK